jgi:hypothetical protein
MISWVDWVGGGGAGEGERVTTAMVMVLDIVMLETLRMLMIFGVGLLKG